MRSFSQKYDALTVTTYGIYVAAIGTLPLMLREIITHPEMDFLHAKYILVPVSYTHLIRVRAGILKITKGAAGRRSAPKTVERSNRTCRSVGGYFFFVPKIRSMSTSITTSITRYSIEPPPCRGKT